MSIDHEMMRLALLDARQFIEGKDYVNALESLVEAGCWASKCNNVKAQVWINRAVNDLKTLVS